MPQNYNARFTTTENKGKYIKWYYTNDIISMQVDEYYVSKP